MLATTLSAGLLKPPCANALTLNKRRRAASAAMAASRQWPAFDVVDIQSRLTAADGNAYKRVRDLLRAFAFINKHEHASR